MRITVIGAGYVGLVTAGCLASEGFHLSCIDNHAEKIGALKRGVLPFYEPGLQTIISDGLKSSQIRFTTCYEEAVAEAEVIFVAVGTPLQGHAELDLSQLFEAAEQLVPYLSSHKIIVIKSTVPIGTARKISSFILQKDPKAKFSIVSNPEFLRAGSAVNDFMQPDRIVLGLENGTSHQLLKRVYKRWISSGTPCIETTFESAEIIKQASNAFLATKLSFINEISDLCELLGANIQEVSQYLSAGPGFGGSCLNKDASSLASVGDACGSDLSIVKAAVSSNQKRKLSLAERVKAYCGGSVEGMRLVILGLTFKEETDDMRESPSLDLIPALEAFGANIVACDPLGRTTAQHILLTIDYEDDAYQALVSADAIILMTAHSQFRQLDLRKVKELMAGNVIIDMRNAFDRESMSKHGFQYYSLGCVYEHNTQNADLKKAS
jgi:UDPglucose 6-dehydrogenase